MLVVVLWGIDGPKKREAELPLASRLTGARGELGTPRVRGLCNGFGLLLPVSRRRGIEEPRMGEAVVETTENRFRETEGNVTGADFGGDILDECV